jgi:hypothetical protein
MVSKTQGGLLHGSRIHVPVLIACQASDDTHTPEVLHHGPSCPAQFQPRPSLITTRGWLQIQPLTAPGAGWMAHDDCPAQHGMVNAQRQVHVASMHCLKPAPTSCGDTLPLSPPGRLTTTPRSLTSRTMPHTRMPTVTFCMRQAITAGTCHIVHAFSKQCRCRVMTMPYARMPTATVCVQQPASRADTQE